LPPQLNLLWFYPNKIMNNSLLPIANAPDIAPLNYLFHHHLQINFSTRSIKFQQAGEYSQWYSRDTHAQAALNNCLEVAVPWSDLQQPPESPIRLVLVLSDAGHFRNYLPENGLIAIEQ
ncbi:MAG: glycoside hydrolase, partial [Rivularia sp. (in: cyanobacteria)]